MSRIRHIEIDDSGLPAPPPQIAQVPKAAVLALLEDNTPAIPGRSRFCRGVFPLACKAVARPHSVASSALWPHSAFNIVQRVLGRYVAPIPTAQLR